MKLLAMRQVKDYGDPEMASLFSENDKHQLFKHFNPSYPNSDPDLEKASAVNVAFCFQKLEGGPAVEITLPALPPADTYGGFKRPRGGYGELGGGPSSRQRY